MNIFKALAMGNALTTLTNVWEAIGYTRETMLTGAGGGFGSLPRAMQEELAPRVQNGWRRWRSTQAIS